MKVELSRFRVKEGKSARVDEWLALLNESMGEVLQTLDRERMKLEVIFREIIDGQEYLYWFVVKDETGASVHTSPFPVDRAHLAFHEECIDHDHGMRDAQAQVVMVPAPVAQAMDWPDPPAAAVPFQHRPILYRRPQNQPQPPAP